MREVHLSDADLSVLAHTLAPLLIPLLRELIISDATLLLQVLTAVESAPEEMSESIADRYAAHVRRDNAARVNSVDPNGITVGTVVEEDR